ncbi:MAG: nicotinamidase [Nitrososphaerota archaeon]|nr:nicotinamidase [Nitrososphaerota archaeon]MDG7027752.1 nicotinamidase [Nitrososphaerota archaeon]MDG7030993.1 nicotinamidase [Nitrososphaerota archaeon]
MRLALLAVDVQVDFCPGGSLAVQSGDEVVPGLNRLILEFQRRGLPVFFTRDWHPRNHASFRSQGGIWPPHCVQDTKGAEFHPGLKVPAGAPIISKGDDPAKEAYSGFHGTDLESRLKRAGVDKVVIGGLTTDYCVRQSSLDAIRAGFKVEVVVDCVRAVNAKRGDGERALIEIERAGARLLSAEAVVRELASTQH